MRRLFCCALGALLLGPAAARAQGATAAPAGASPAAPIVVPFVKLRSLHFVVETRVNDKGPFRLVFDTGSPITFISGRAALQAGLLEAAATKTPALMGMRGQRTVKSFSVGKASVNGLNLMILDHPVIDVLSQVDGPVDGIVGHTFFARYVTTIDYSRSELTLTPNGVVPADALTGLAARLQAPRTAPAPLRPRGVWGWSLEDAPAVEGMPAAPGVMVRAVVPGSAAAAAGLRAGDRLLTLDGRWTDTAREAYEAAAQAGPGAIMLKVLRGGEEREIRVVPRPGA